MACGALRGRAGQTALGGSAGQAALSPAQWLTPARGARFLFPVHALSRVLRGKFLQALQDAEQASALPRDPAPTALQRAQRLRALRQHDWVVYAKTPLTGPAAVLDYLSRYTHRTAIGNERLVAVTATRCCCGCAPTTAAACG